MFVVIGSINTPRQQQTKTMLVMIEGRKQLENVDQRIKSPTRENVNIGSGLERIIIGRRFSANTFKAQGRGKLLRACYYRGQAFQIRNNHLQSFLGH